VRVGRVGNVDDVVASWGAASSAPTPNRLQLRFRSMAVWKTAATKLAPTSNATAARSRRPGPAAT